MPSGFLPHIAPPPIILPALKSERRAYTTRKELELDAHTNEYAAAVAGMQETYGKSWSDTSNTTPAVGDFVSGLTAGRRWSGRVQAVEADRMVVDVDGAVLSVSTNDITH